MSTIMTVQSYLIEGEIVLYYYYYYYFVCLYDNDIQDRFMHLLRESDINMKLVSTYKENFLSFFVLFIYKNK